MENITIKSETLLSLGEPQSELLQSYIEELEQSVIKMSIMMVTTDVSDIGIAQDIHRGMSSSLLLLKTIQREVDGEEPDETAKE